MTTGKSILGDKPAEVHAAEKALAIAHINWAKAKGLKMVIVKDTYGELPGALAFVIDESPSKLTVIRPIVAANGGIDVEGPWRIQKASCTEESLKAAGIKYSH